MASINALQCDGPLESAWVLSVGTELTLGQTVDTNAAWLAARLAEFGVRTTRHVTVADERDALVGALKEAVGCTDLIVVSGGLGPTDDDLTRQAISEAASAPLREDPRSVDQIRAFFASRGRPMPERNRVQGLIPAGGVAIENTCGTAPGIAVVLQGRPLFALPGVPFEMREMFTRSVAPRIEAGARGMVLRSRVLHSIGLGESDIGDQIRDLMERGRNPDVGTTAQLGIIGIRINARASGPSAAAELLDATETEVRRRLGELVFGCDDETLQSVVGCLLADRRLTLGTAESCTGGLIAAHLTDVPGASAYFLGGTVTYANRAKVEQLGVAPELIESAGAVSEPVAREMAAGVRRMYGSDLGLSVTGIAGPAGGSAAKPVGTVCFGLATDAGVSTRTVLYGSDSPRSVIRERAARTALNLVRHCLLRTEPGT